MPLFLMLLAATFTVSVRVECGRDATCRDVFRCDYAAGGVQFRHRDGRSWPEKSCADDDETCISAAYRDATSEVCGGTP